MRMAMLSDAHGNAEALALACRRAAGQADQIVFLGDLIDGTPSDTDCISLIRAHAEAVVRGNHDDEQLELTPHTLCITPEYRWLAQQPTWHRIGEFFLIHDDP